MAKIRDEVFAWRGAGYAGASESSRALLNWWFGTEHLTEQADGTLSPFRYYFAQREAVETVIWLHDVRTARDKFDLLRFDASGAVSSGMFDEDWPRYVLKMATGAGKTKVLSLLIAWSFFHKLYEPDSTLARNFLSIAPNIIVLDRLRADFDGLRIFFNDPILPDNGHDGRNWRDDFQLTLHIQDDVRVVRDTGNLFLTNIHRVYLGDVREPSLEDDDLRDYFLAPSAPSRSARPPTARPTLARSCARSTNWPCSTTRRTTSTIRRWPGSSRIQDIHHRMLQKDCRLALQVDVTATPRHNNGAIFVQTVSDYPLVEAIHQNVVKHPVLPDAASRASCTNTRARSSPRNTTTTCSSASRNGARATPNTRRWARRPCCSSWWTTPGTATRSAPIWKRSAPSCRARCSSSTPRTTAKSPKPLPARTRKNWSGCAKQSNEIDTWKSPYKAIVSVLMLKEGWDVRNVTTIVGLRAYAAKSNILPEQTLGRGLRRMYFGTDSRETVSVMGTPAFMDFVESIQSEGVTFERVPMGGGARRARTRSSSKWTRRTPTRISTRWISRCRGSRGASTANSRTSTHSTPPRSATPASAQAVHAGGNPRDRLQDHARRRSASHHSARRYRTCGLPLGGRFLCAATAEGPAPGRRLRRALPQGEDFHARASVRRAPVNLEDPVVLRNLSEPEAGKVLFDAFKTAINALTVQDKGSARIEDRIRLRDTRPFRTEHRPYLAPRKSLFNKIVGEPHAGGFELALRRLPRRRPGRRSVRQELPRRRLQDRLRQGRRRPFELHARFYRADHRRHVWIVETKGREELDLPQKMARLRQWCDDATAASRAEGGTTYRFVYVDQQGYERSPPADFAGLATAFRDFQG